MTAKISANEMTAARIHLQRDNPFLSAAIRLQSCARVPENAPNHCGRASVLIGLQRKTTQRSNHFPRDGWTARTPAERAKATAAIVSVGKPNTRMGSFLSEWCAALSLPSHSRRTIDEPPQHLGQLVWRRLAERAGDQLWGQCLQAATSLSGSGEDGAALLKPDAGLELAIQDDVAAQH